MLRIRIIPITITTAVLFLGVKVVDVVRGTEGLSEQLLISKVSAEQTPKENPPKEIPGKEGEKPAEGEASDESKKEGDAPAEGEEQKKEGEGDASKKEGEGEHGGDKKSDNPNVSSEAGKTVDNYYSAVELELLQNLSRRRQELDRWEANIQIKEAALGATEKRINEKIDQINNMKKEISKLLAEYNAQQDAKIRSLVKIYESMKPKDSARIFDTLEMPVLLMVIDKMSEKKAAPILAEMDSRKAKQVTVELAAQRSIDNSKITNPSPIQATP